MAETWLREARIVAQLQHPHIVPVYEVGSTAETPAYIVSQYIDGCSLAERLRQSPLPLVEAIDLIVDVAEALDYAHRSRGEVVHRDIKPGNLLLDNQGKIYVADFGLALRESDPVRQGDFAGTPAYMSPEQVRGEGHLVDGRSDIFSLGVVLYELRTGRRPFRGQRDELLTEIRLLDPKPPRQLNAEISPELERICLKALAKLASERYSTARDLAADLRLLRASEWLPGMAQPVVPTATPLSPNTPPTPAPSPPAETGDSNLSPAAASGSSRTVAIVPKGLRSFDASDSGFFLDLLPGARDRTGLPESLRFWKGRIEQTDGAPPLRVGLLTGPSGCGKSSLVKAGLLPRLAPEILPLYLEATTDDTERRIVALLHRHLPKLERIDNLADCLTAVRRGQAGLGRRKLLLVIDQFEQWLHAHQFEKETVLTQALRQCDGERLQGLLLVRDDYFPAVYRFFKLLEIPLVQGENNATVDLFDSEHARKVLTAFGRAWRKLPAESAELSVAQHQFVDQAVAGIAEQHRVIPVQLAIFAEMFKQRPWTSDALVEVGGAEGVGRAFLEETFRADKAPPKYRLHAKGAQRVLTALLPEVGSDIKGHRRSRDELIAAAGYASRPAEGAELLRMLDRELRLITPVDEDAEDGDHPEPEAAGKKPEPTTGYHLTHDYLVPSLRRWVEDILGSTPAGRAKLLLRERSRLWNDRPLNRNLPSLGEHLRIRRWVPLAERSGPERALLAQSAKVHGRWGVFALAGVVLLAVGAGCLWQDRRQREAVAQVRVLESAVASDWNRTFDTLRREGLTKLAERPLRERLAEAEAAGDTLTVVKMRTGLLATQGDTTQAEPLGQALLTLPAAEFGVVLDLLVTVPTQDFVASLWSQATDHQHRFVKERFQAAAALARLAPNDARWLGLTPLIVSQLSSLSGAELIEWRAMFKPIAHLLSPIAADIVVAAALDPITDHLWIENLKEFDRDNGEFLGQAVLSQSCTAERFDWLLRSLTNKQSPQLVERLECELAVPQPVFAYTEKQYDEAMFVIERKAKAAAGLARLGQVDKVWPLLVFDPQSADPQTLDPSLRTELIVSLGEYGVPVESVLNRLLKSLQSAKQQPRDIRETSIQRALLLALARYLQPGYDPYSIQERSSSSVESDGMQNKFAPDAKRISWRRSDEARLQLEKSWNLMTDLESDPDPGIHGAYVLLQRELKLSGELPTAWARSKQPLEHLQVPKTVAPPTWYVNSQGQTIVVFPPGVFRMGQSSLEQEYFDDLNDHDNHAHREIITRSFAISSTEITRGQYAVFERETGRSQNVPLTLEAYNYPQTSVTWFDAAHYCNWLSAKEGLPMCYRISGTGQDMTVTMEPDFLDRNGYRLPTEAEWEYAYRSGVDMPWSHGFDGQSLIFYANFRDSGTIWSGGRQETSTFLSEVANNFPNETGLFDMAGNAMEWCQDEYLPYFEKRFRNRKHLENPTTVTIGSHNRVLRGGSFLNTASNLRAAVRTGNEPGSTNIDVSFCPARTYP